MPTRCQSQRFIALPRGSGVWRAVCLVGLSLLTGCAAMHPIHGIPAGYLPLEYLGRSRDGLRPINPMLLTRSRPCEHLIDSGDVLSIFIPGVLGTVSTDLHTVGEYPPINFPQDRDMPPTIGFPVTVRGDGTVSLPQVPPINVRGLTVSQAEEAVRQAYLHPRQILPAGKERVLVSLQRVREYRVLVVREDSGFATETTGVGTINLGQARRGTARVVSLKAYENDVLHALARGEGGAGSDGLPGLDAEGAVYVIRRRAHNAAFGLGGHQCPVNGPLGPGFVGGAGTGFIGGAAPQGPYFPPADGTVIRFQSPEGDYRNGSGYGGHSFAGGGTSGSTPGRYGTALPAGPQPQFGSGSNGGRYVTRQPASTSAFPPAAALPTGGGRYGATSSPAQFANAQGITPTNWTTIPQRQPVDGAARYASQSLPAAPTPGALQTAQSWEPGPVYGASPSQMFPPSANSQYAPQGAPQFVPQAAPAMTGGWPMAAPQIALPQGAAPQYSTLPSGLAYGPMGGTPHDEYFRSMLASGITGTIDDPNVLRIPIRVLPGETPHISESDVTLEDGDIVFIEARDSEVFYTGGLLGGGQFTLPRDHDLHVLEAISIAQAQGARGGGGRTSSGGVSALNQDVTISGSKLIVLRKLPDGSHVPIEIDLNRAKRDTTGRENIIIQPGDFLILQYTCCEAIGAFFERHLLESALFGVAAAQLSTGSGN